MALIIKRIICLRKQRQKIQCFIVIVLFAYRLGVASSKAPEKRTQNNDIVIFHWHRH